MGRQLTRMVQLEAQFMERVRAREREMQKKELKPAEVKQRQQEKQQKKSGKN